MTALVILPFLILLGVLVLVAYTARVYNEAGKFLSREFQENIEYF